MRAAAPGWQHAGAGARAPAVVGKGGAEARIVDVGSALEHHVSALCEAGSRFAGPGPERLLRVALGRGANLGAAVARSVEALSFWLGGGTGGIGRNGGGRGSGGGDGDHGDMALDPDSAREILALGEEDEDGRVPESRELRNLNDDASPLTSLDASRTYFVSGLEVINVEGMVSSAP